MERNNLIIIVDFDVPDNYEKLEDYLNESLKIYIKSFLPKTIKNLISRYANGPILNNYLELLKKYDKKDFELKKKEFFETLKVKNNCELILYNPFLDTEKEIKEIALSFKNILILNSYAQEMDIKFQFAVQKLLKELKSNGFKGTCTLKRHFFDDEFFIEITVSQIKEIANKVKGTKKYIFIAENSPIKSVVQGNYLFQVRETAKRIGEKIGVPVCFNRPDVSEWQEGILAFYRKRFPLKALSPEIYDVLYEWSKENEGTTFFLVPITRVFEDIIIHHEIEEYKKFVEERGNNLIKIPYLSSDLRAIDFFLTLISSRSD